MASLDELRQKIDEINKLIVTNLDERARLAVEIGKMKAKDNQAIFDPSRQKNILKQVASLGDGSFPTDALQKVFLEIMSACLSLERKLKIGYFGGEASFTHMASLAEFGSSVEYLSHPTIQDIFLAVVKREIDYGVVPIENSTGGIVHYTLDMFMEYDVKIFSEVILQIRQNLLSRFPLDEIKVIYSNPQPFLQCHNWLREHLPKAEHREVVNTIDGVKLALTMENSAAIASDYASELYSISIVAKSIEDIPDNCTRFWVIGKDTAPPSGNDKTSLLISIKDKPGALFYLLKPFAELGINLTKIESRPTKKKAWEYVFFIDLHGHYTDHKVQKALKMIEPEVVFVKVMGSYPFETTAKNI